VVDGSRANELRRAERGAAMVFQSSALYPYMTVVRNMGFALKMAGVRRAQREEELYRRPANEFVAGFIGAPRINLIGRPEATDATAAHRSLWYALAGEASIREQRAGLLPDARWALAFVPDGRFLS
jgi:ABC-type sugar transport system ATPase subunit